jgi:uncharacterized protein DUF4340
MKLRGLIVAAVVLAGLTGALYWSDHHKPKETTEASADASPKVLALKEEDIAGFNLKKNGAEQVGLERDNTGKWKIVAPTPLPADESAVSSLLGTFSSLNSQRVVEDKATDLATYGLATPQLEADLTQKDKKTQKLLLGDNTPAGNGMYAKLDSDPRIFVIAGYEKTSIDKGPNDLRDKRLVTLEEEKISQVELASKKQDVTFGRNKDEWQIVKPKPFRADGSAVDDLVRELADAKMEIEGTDDQKKTAAAFASATPVATAKITAESGSQELQVRKSKTDYYAKSSVVEGVYKVAGTLGEQLAKSLEDYRNKKLFDFGSDDPDKIEFRNGMQTSFLTRSGEDWWSGSAKKLDAGTVQEFVDKVRDLAASKSVDSVFTAPAIDLAVTSKEGKRVEKVALSKSGDSYVAKRENDATLYQIDAKTVDELGKAADAIKPASPAAPQKK